VVFSFWCNSTYDTKKKLVHLIFRNVTKRKIFLGNDSSHKILVKAILVVELEDGSKRHVENVYHIPSLKKNFMSISKITNAWYKLEFSFESCLIKEK